MTVGYRYWAGIGTKQSCKDALGWYKSAADAALRSFNAGPPGGRHLPPPKIRLSDLEGGPYGPGASSARPSLTTGGSNAQTQSTATFRTSIGLEGCTTEDLERAGAEERATLSGGGCSRLGSGRARPMGCGTAGAISTARASGSSASRGGCGLPIRAKRPGIRRRAPSSRRRQRPRPRRVRRRGSGTLTRPRIARTTSSIITRRWWRGWRRVTWAGCTSAGKGCPSITQRRICGSREARSRCGACVSDVLAGERLRDS